MSCSRFRAFSSRLNARAPLIATTFAGLALLIAGATPAPARVHTFKELGGKAGTTSTFRVVGVDADAIVDARLVGPGGKKKVDVAIVRRGALSPSHRVRIPTGSRVRALKVTTAQETTITAGPAEGSETTSTTAEFSFTSSAKGKAKFYCSLDGAPDTVCASGVAYSELSEGPHSFQVYSVDRRGTADPTPATRSWSVVSPGPAPSPEPTPEPAPADTYPPDTRITGGPAEGSSTTSSSASFSFDGSDDVGVPGYECKLDGSTWASCSSPKGYSGLGVGSHTSAVRAKDAASNVDPSPATRTWTVTASGDVYTVPASVPSGCTTDATSEILAWIASVPDGATLRFGAGACYRIEGTIELQGRTLTIDGNGSTFKALDPPSSHSAIWRAWDSSVTFRDMTIVGSYADGGVHNFDLQWAHGIDLRGTHGVVENVSMSDLAGDCVYFGLGEGRSSGAVRDSSCRRIGRNAVSVTAGDDITVERVTTDRIGFIAFDVEPDPEAGNGSSRVVFDSNTIGSYYLYAWAVVGNAPIADQAFTNNRVVGKGLRIAALYPTYRPQRLTVTGNSSDTNQGAPAMQFNGVDDLTVSGNTVPLTSGAMASVKNSCDVNVSGNSFPGGSQEASITKSAC
jgi:hypothetical protein